MKGFIRPKRDVFFTTLPLFYYQQYIIFSLQKYLFFNVKNKVVLMWGE